MRKRHWEIYTVSVARTCKAHVVSCGALLMSEYTSSSQQVRAVARQQLGFGHLLRFVR